MATTPGDKRELEVMLLSGTGRKAVCLVRRRMTVARAVEAVKTLSGARTFVQAAVGTEAAWRVPQR